MTTNGDGWVWIVGVLEGLGDFAAEVRSGIVDAPKLPDEFDARRLSHLAPRPMQGHPGKSSLAIVPWLGHAFRIVSDGGIVRLRGASVPVHARATAELAEEAERVWNPPMLVTAPAGAEPPVDAVAQMRALKKGGLV